MSPEPAHRALVNVLRLAAAEPCVQLASVPDGTVKTDEIALTVCQTIEWAVDVLSLSDAAVRALREIDALFDAMSDCEELWTEQALIDRSEWEVVRRESDAVLRTLGEEPGPPDLSWITYVSS